MLRSFIKFSQLILYKNELLTITLKQQEVRAHEFRVYIGKDSHNKGLEESIFLQLKLSDVFFQQA